MTTTDWSARERPAICVRRFDKLCAMVHEWRARSGLSNRALPATHSRAFEFRASDSNSEVNVNCCNRALALIEHLADPGQ